MALGIAFLHRSDVQTGPTALHFLILQVSNDNCGAAPAATFQADTMQELTPSQVAQRLHQLTEVSVALGDGHDIGALLERILHVAKSMTDADGGTLYRPSEDRKSLCFHISV